MAEVMMLSQSFIYMLRPQYIQCINVFYQQVLYLYQDLNRILALITFINLLIKKIIGYQHIFVQICTVNKHITYSKRNPATTLGSTGLEMS